jgi:RimJ/RimL family protein N-acetyltransferase
MTTSAQGRLAPVAHRSVRLKRFAVGDVDRLLGWIDSAEFLAQWAGPAFTWPLTSEELLHYEGSGLRSVPRHVSELTQPARLIFTVRDTGGGEPLGHAELNHIDPHNLSATISRLLVGDPQQRRQGYGTAILAALCGLAFDHLGLHRVDLYVMEANQPARACYEAFGFRPEGHFREARRIGDDFWSVDYLAMLADEWRQRSSPASNRP